MPHVPEATVLTLTGPLTVTLPDGTVLTTDQDVIVAGPGLGIPQPPVEEG